MDWEMMRSKVQATSALIKQGDIPEESEFLHFHFLYLGECLLATCPNVRVALAQVGQRRRIDTCSPEAPAQEAIFINLSEFSNKSARIRSG